MIESGRVTESYPGRFDEMANDELVYSRRLIAELGQEGPYDGLIRSLGGTILEGVGGTFYVQE